MTRAKLNVLLLVGVAVLAWLGWSSREQPEAEAPLTALVDTQIEHIRIEHLDRPAIALSRKADGGWQLTEPVRADADAFEVAALLNLASLPVRRTLKGEFDAAGVGLVPPALVITLNDQALRFGGTNPISAQRVIQTDQHAVLVDNPPSAALDDDYTDLLSKQLIPEGAEITAIELSEGRRVDAEGMGWRVDGHPELDPTALVEGWLGVRAMWNSAAPVVEADTTEAVTIHLASGEPVALQVVRRAPQFEVINPALGVQYTLSAVLADTLLTLAESSDAEPTPVD